MSSCESTYSDMALNLIHYDMYLLLLRFPQLASILHVQGGVCI